MFFVFPERVHITAESWMIFLVLLSCYWFYLGTPCMTFPEKCQIFAEQLFLEKPLVMCLSQKYCNIIFKSRSSYWKTRELKRYRHCFNDHQRHHFYYQCTKFFRFSFTNELIVLQNLLYMFSSKWKQSNKSCITTGLRKKPPKRCLGKIPSRKMSPENFLKKYCPLLRKIAP